MRCLAGQGMAELVVRAELAPAVHPEVKGRYRFAMKRNEFLKALDRLSMWRSHGQRAPHKPLLLLLALGRLFRAGTGWLTTRTWRNPSLAC